MWRRPACQTLSKALDISSATARVAPDLLKALAILSDTTVRRSNFGKFVWKIRDVGDTTVAVLEKQFGQR